MRPITLEEQARLIDHWKKVNGITGHDYMPRNSGATRTPSKRALLKALAELSQKTKTASRE